MAVRVVFIKNLYYFFGGDLVFVVVVVVLLLLCCVFNGVLVVVFFFVEGCVVGVLFCFFFVCVGFGVGLMGGVCGGSGVVFLFIGCVVFWGKDTFFL